MGSKKIDWLIIFPDSWMDYSPSLLNFIKMIEEQGETYIILTYNDHMFKANSIDQHNKRELRINPFFAKFLSKVRLLKLFKIIGFIFLIYKEKKFKTEFSRSVGFDEVGYIIARLFDKNAIYYSLEISNSILNKVIFRYLKPRLLIIQSEERKKYLIKDSNYKNVAYIQNSPILINKPSIKRVYNYKLVYFGNVIKGHGIEECIKLLRFLDQETLTIKGLSVTNRKYIDKLIKENEDLIKAGRLCFNFEYIENNEIPLYLSQFSIGLCFYDMSLKYKKDFNYLTSPSGKMFYYFQSGLPVIGIDFPGLVPVKEFNAGVLVPDYSIENLIKAIDKIKSNYAMYSENAIKAAEHYDYRRMFLQEKDKIYGANDS